MAPNGLNALRNTHNFDLSTLATDSLSSKVIIVTGGNSGVGKETVLQLCQHRPSKIYLTARSRSKFDSAVDDIVIAVTSSPPSSKTPSSNRGSDDEAIKACIHYLELDLASFASIKSAADKILAENDRLDILINNAGIMASPPGLTEQGYESHFGTNHMGPAFFTRLLMPLMLKTAAAAAGSGGNADVRIINLSSAAYSLAPGTSGFPFLNKISDNDSSIRTPTGGHRWSYTRYGQSKLANIVHAKQLAERYGDKGITAVSVHPGRVATNLLSGRFNGMFDLTGLSQKLIDFFICPMTVAEGAMNQLWAAVGDREQIATNGGYYTPVGVEVDVSKGTGAKDVHGEAAGRLWDWQEKEFEKWLRDTE